MASLDYIARMPELPVPHEGVFALEVHVGDELIGMIRVSAALAESEKNENENGDENE